MTAHAQRISTIDRQINQIRLALQTLETVSPYSALSWQQAWDKHPELREQETELFCQRGIAQQERDNAAAKMAARARRVRTKKCPTCGSHSYAA